MPTTSPGSENYVVYTLENEDTASNSGLEDGQIVFRDPEHISLQDKNCNVKTNGNGRFRSISFESSSHWGHRSSLRRKCCCLWNIVVLIVIVVLATLLVITYKDYDLLKSSLSNKTSSDAQSLSETITTTSPRPTIQRQICETTECVHQAASVLARMNTNINPCEDFYEYACGGFSNTPHLSWDSQRVLEVPDVLREKYRSQLEDSLSAPILPTDPVDRRTVKAFYKDCKTNTDNVMAAREKMRNLLVSLKSNNGRNMKNDTKNYITTLLATVMKKYGATPFFTVIVKKNGDITITNRYSNDFVKELFSHGVEIPSFRHLMPADFNFRYPPDQVLMAYERYLTESQQSIFGNGTSYPEVNSLLQSTFEVFEFEMALNKVWYSDGGVNYSEEISYCKNRMSLSTLQSTYPGFNINWKVFFSILLDRQVDENLELCHADLIAEIASVISEAKVDLVTNYILTHTFINTDLYKYVYRQFPKFAKSTSVYRPVNIYHDSSYCISFISQHFPLASIFKSNHSSYFESIARSLFVSIKQSLVQTIHDLYWIPQDQRNDIILHTQRVNLSFGWNSNHRDDYAYMTGDYQQNIIGAIEANYNNAMKGIHITSPFDQTVASYNSWNREIEISSLALFAPVYYNNSSDSVLIGTVGGMLAQSFAEVFSLHALLSHFLSGTLDTSVLYTLANHHQCLIEFYNTYHYTNENGDTVHVRGDLTKSSNFRDLLSIHLALKTFENSLPFEKVIDLPGVNYTSLQTFLISYAQLYCEKVTPKGKQQYYVNNEDSKNPMPNEFRVKGMMANTRHFSEAFHCPLNSNMNPTKRCTIF